MELEERVYLIKYKQYDSNGGAFKYAEKPTYAEHKRYFGREDRDKFIEKYLYLKRKYTDDMYITDVECYFSNLTYIDDERMALLINQV